MANSALRCKKYGKGRGSGTHHARRDRIARGEVSGSKAKKAKRSPRVTTLVTKAQPVITKARPRIEERTPTTTATTPARPPLSDAAMDGAIVAIAKGLELLYKTPIEELGLSVRPYNILKRVGVNTVGELVSHSRDHLMGPDFPNFGAKAADEVQEKLAAFDPLLKLKESAPVTT